MAEYIKLSHLSGKFLGLLLVQFVILPGLFGLEPSPPGRGTSQKVQVKLQTGSKVIQKNYQISGRVLCNPPYNFTY